MYNIHCHQVTSQLQLINIIIIIIIIIIYLLIMLDTLLRYGDLP